MCYGCMTFSGATQFLQKQSNYLVASPTNQLELSKKNKPYDPNDDSIMNYVAGVENLLPINEWNKDKLKLFMYLANGLKGRIATSMAIKLILLYEQWLPCAPLEKQKEYYKLCKENIEELKRIDNWFLRNDGIPRGPMSEETKKLHESTVSEKLKDLDELYSKYDNMEITSYFLQ